MSDDSEKLMFDKSIIDVSKQRTTVRFTSEEYSKIKNDSFVFEKSLPALLKKSYFGRLPTTILMTPENYKIFYRVYSGIANNLNQLTKRAHLGFSVPENSLKQFFESNERLLTKIRDFNGNC